MRSSHRYNSGGTASRRGRSRQRKQSDHANDAIHPRQASHSMSNSGVRKRLHSHQRLAIIVRLCPVQVFSFCRNITLLSLYISMYKRMGLYHRLGMVRIITKGQRRREANLIFLGATSLVFFFPHPTRPLIPSLSCLGRLTGHCFSFCQTEHMYGWTCHRGGLPTASYFLSSFSCPSLFRIAIIVATTVTDLAMDLRRRELREDEPNG